MIGSCGSRSNSRYYSSLILWLALVVNVIGVASGKKISGDFTLSGVTTEHVLGSFAISQGSSGSLSFELSSDSLYRDSRSLRFRLYSSDEWPKYHQTMTCVDKTQFALQTKPLSFERTIDTKTKKAEYKTRPVRVKLNNEMDMDLIRQQKATKYRSAKGTVDMEAFVTKIPKYYYFVIDDCSLEMYFHDQEIPKIHFELQVLNGDSHLSADENHLHWLHVVTLCVSGIIAALTVLAIVIQLSEKATVHAAMFLVMSAATCDAASSLCEILHLSIYAKNGIGSYALDALSAHLEAVCDSLVALLLLSIAAGWTLPTDVIAVDNTAATTNSNIQKVLSGLRTPFAVMIGVNPNRKSISSSSIFALIIILVHVVLAQWGRVYNDDFDSYHDLEHLPGKLLMMIRVILGIGFLISCFQTKSKCRMNKLQFFYIQLALIGTMWFQCLPFMTFACNKFAPYYLRHWAISICGAFLQCASILLLTWLVGSTSAGNKSSTYHQYSTLSTKPSSSLTDALSSSAGTTQSVRIWNLGRAKIRLD